MTLDVSRRRLFGLATAALAAPAIVRTINMTPECQPVPIDFGTSANVDMLTQMCVDAVCRVMAIPAHMLPEVAGGFQRIIESRLG